MTYADLKDFFVKYWKWVLGPLIALVVVDWLFWILALTQVVIASYMGVLAAGVVVGVYEGMRKESALCQMRIARLIPSLKWGKDLVDWCGEDVENTD